MGGKERGTGRIGRFTQNKSIVAVGVEPAVPRGLGSLPIAGRLAWAVLPDVTRASAHGFVDSRVQRGSALWTDKFASYGGLSWRGYYHAAIPLGENRALLRRFFPWVHIVLSNLKRFLLGTHHMPEAKHLPRYVAEFTYRFNRRGQESTLFRHLARACLSTKTITYKDLVAAPEVA